MGRVNTPKLTISEQNELEHLYRSSENHSFRKRCQTILLKAQGRTSKDVGVIVGMSHVSVNSWLGRYQKEGIAGLFIKQGRGRKPILDITKDRGPVLEAVKKHRQSVSQAKAEWEAAADKSIGRTAFKRFLKSLAEDIKE